MAAVSAQIAQVQARRQSRRARRRSPRPRGCISAFSTRAGAGTRPFGSFGLSLDRPRTRLTLDARRTAFEVDRPGARARPRAICAASPQASASRRAYDLQHRARRSRRMRVFGSGTQLALAVGSAFAALEGARLDSAGRSPRGSAAARVPASASPPSRKAASCSTAVRARATLPQLVSRLPFPPEWRVLLIFDSRAARARRSERDGGVRHAARIFRRARPTSFTGASLRARCRRLTPRDFATFCEQVGHLQSCDGRLFRAAARRTLCQPTRRRRCSIGCAQKASPGSARARGDRPDSPSRRPRRKAKRCSTLARARSPIRAQFRAGARPQRRRENRDERRRNPVKLRLCRPLSALPLANYVKRGRTPEP